MYQDIDNEDEKNKCVRCGSELHGGHSPWSICFDPYWQENVWGGDSHETRGMFCQVCAEKIITGKRE